MKQIVIIFSITAIALTTGCSVPSKPELRIAISASPGSAILYLAQEKNLFQEYGAEVHLVELNTGCECAVALAEGHVDAVVMPYGELSKSANFNQGVGILMLLGSHKDTKVSHSHDRDSPNLSDFRIEVLAGARSDLMLRRQEWQRVMLAYEHARLLLAGEFLEHVKIIADRERRSVSAFEQDFEKWNIFGIADQDSLLESRGPYSTMSAHWHGRQFMTAAVTSELRRGQSRREQAGQGDQVK